MTMKTPLFLLCLVACSLSGLLEARLWRSSDGKKSFEADYISNDAKQVTLKKGTGLVTFDIKKLHIDDQTWLKKNHPLKKNDAQNHAPPPKGAAFGTLEFGDTHREVIKKLKESPIVESGAADVMLARIGLNGTYRTKQTIGGLHCYLFFDWTEAGTLREVSLRSKPLDASSYGGSLKANWKQLIELLSQLHGKPVQDGFYPDSEDLQDGLILCSHLWNNSAGHSVLLGTGQEGDKYSVVVRITSERIKPVILNE